MTNDVAIGASLEGSKALNSPRWREERLFARYWHQSDGAGDERPSVVEVLTELLVARTGAGEVA